MLFTSTTSLLMLLAAAVSTSARPQLEVLPSDFAPLPSVVDDLSLSAALPVPSDSLIVVPTGSEGSAIFSLDLPSESAESSVPITSAPASTTNSGPVGQPPRSTPPLPTATSTNTAPAASTTAAAFANSAQIGWIIAAAGALALVV